MGVAIDTTWIIVGRLERTEPNLIHLKWGGVNTHSHLKYDFFTKVTLHEETLT